MKLIRIGNDIKINWTITRFGEPEDFSNKNLSVVLYDKFNTKQIFDYIVTDNKITGTFYGKDQTTNGVYRLFLVENEGDVDMVSLDYIDCFCISNKLKNQTSNGQDSSNINTEVVEVSSEMNTTTDLTEYAKKTYVDAAIVELHSEIETEMPTKTSDLTNDSGFITSADIPSIPTKTSDLTNDSGFITDADVPTKTSDLTNDSGFITDADVPTKTSDLTNDSGFITDADVPTKTSDLTNDSGFITSSILAAVATSGDYDDLINKPTIPTKTSDLTNDSGFITSAAVPTKTSDLTNDSGFITSADIPSIPTKTSDLTNDSGFITDADVPTKTSDLTNDSGFITSADVPTKTSDLTNDSGFITSAAVPTKTSDLTNDSGFITASDIPAIPTKTSDLTNDSGFITDADIPTKTSDLVNDSGFITSSILAAVATTGDYNDLSNKPTIPVVPTNISAFTNDSGYINQIKTINNQSLIGTGNITISGSSVQSDWSQTDTTADDYIKNKPTIPTKTSDLTNDSGFITSSILAAVATTGDYADLINKPTNLVTTNKAQDITGTKTFVGDKKIKFSQSTSYDKMGFTLNDNNAKEVATFEFRPDTINYSGVNHPLLYLGHYRNNIVAHAGVPQTFVGFRQYDANNSAAYHFLMPLPEMAKTTFSLTTTFKDFYAPLGFKNSNYGVTVATAADTGMVDLQGIIPNKTSDLTNDSGFITSAAVPTKTSDLTNDSGYITASDIPTIPTKTSDLTNDSGFITSSILAAVATSGDYNDLSNKPTIPVVPTNISAFTNDSGYINQIKTINNQSLIGTGNITISGSSVQSDWNQTDTTADDYIKNKPTIPTKTSDLTNDSGFITSAAVPTKTSDLTNDSGFITSIPNTVVTSTTQNLKIEVVAAMPASPAANTIYIVQ